MGRGLTTRSQGHSPAVLTEVGTRLRKIVLGYYQYRAVTGNSTQLRIFCPAHGLLDERVHCRKV